MRQGRSTTGRWRDCVMAGTMTGDRLSEPLRTRACATGLRSGTGRTPRSGALWSVGDEPVSTPPRPAGGAPPALARGAGAARGGRGAGGAWRAGRLDGGALARPPDRGAARGAAHPCHLRRRGRPPGRGPGLGRGASGALAVEPAGPPDHAAGPVRAGLPPARRADRPRQPRRRGGLDVRGRHRPPGDPVRGPQPRPGRDRNSAPPATATRGPSGGWTAISAARWWATCRSIPCAAPSVVAYHGLTDT